MPQFSGGNSCRVCLYDPFSNRVVCKFTDANGTGIGCGLGDMVKSTCHTG